MVEFPARNHKAARVLTQLSGETHVLSDQIHRALKMRTLYIQSRCTQ